MVNVNKSELVLLNMWLYIKCMITFNSHSLCEEWQNYLLPKICVNPKATDAVF